MRTVTAHHDGYRHLGWRHERTLTLDAGGTVLCGADSMVPTGRRPRGRNLRARFHLHPDVSVSLEGDAARLGGWRLASPDAALRLEPSVYAPRFYEMRETTQVVLERPLSAGSAALRWRLERVP